MPIDTKSYPEIFNSPERALAYLAGGNSGADENLLVSPFPPDAKIHAACVWGQRLTGAIPFPTGFEKGFIYKKTKEGGSYLGWVVALNINSPSSDIL